MSGRRYAKRLTQNSSHIMSSSCMNRFRPMLIGSLLFIAACGEQADSPVVESVSQPVVLPEIEIQEGDGLPPNLPDNLEWETNDSDPIYASIEAKKGGTLRSYMLSFPLTLRLVGPDSNGSFAGVMRANLMGLVSLHPQTRNVIPGLATHWAYGPDGRSMYYKLDPKARWSDGVPVTADDFVFTVQFMRSKEIVAPFYNDYYTDRIRDVKKYDAHVIGIQGADAKPPKEMHSNYAIGPTPRHFHVLNDQWVKDFNWKVQPNTGPYQVSTVEKGKYIEITRKKDWWAKDLRFYKNRFNVDKVRYRVIRDLNIAYQHFLKGELDTFGLVVPQFWHDKATGEEFDKGFIRKYWFYNDRPVTPGGMFLNVADPILADRNVRYGIAHAMNFDRVIKTVLRDDYERLSTFHLGFGDYDNSSIEPRGFDLDLADSYFEEAGFDERNSDGIRVKSDGTRLSLRVTYGAPHHTDRLVVLQEEAKKSGLELVLQLLDPSSSFKQLQEKKHQIGWMTWSSGGLAPTFWQFFHSDNANKPQTNNIMNYSDAEVDQMIMDYRASSDMDERTALARDLELRIHDSGVFVPSFQVPYTREGAWRWVKLPENLGTRTSGSLFSALEGGTYSSGGLMWIDLDEKKNTLDTKESNGQFEPLTVINTDYRR